MGLIAEFTQLPVHFLFQVELTSHTLKLINNGMRAYCLQCLEPSGFEPFPDKQTNTVTLFSPENISTVEVFCISKMWWVWYHIENSDLSMAECDVFHR